MRACSTPTSTSPAAVSGGGMVAAHHHPVILTIWPPDQASRQLCRGHSADPPVPPCPNGRSPSCPLRRLGRIRTRSTGQAPRAHVPLRGPLARLALRLHPGQPAILAGGRSSATEPAALPPFGAVAFQHRACEHLAEQQAISRQRPRHSADRARSVGRSAGSASPTTVVRPSHSRACDRLGRCAGRIVPARAPVRSSRQPVS